MKKACRFLIICIIIILIFSGCASQEEMQGYYDDVYNRATPAPSVSATPTPDPQTTREQGLALVQGLDLGDTNIKDTKVNFVFENVTDTIYKYSGDIYEYGVSALMGKLIIVNRNKLPDNFTITIMLSKEEILPLAMEYAKKLVPEFDLTTMNQKVKPYKLGKGDETDPLRTNYIVDFITLKSNIDIKHKVSLEFDQNGNLMYLEASYNPDAVIDENVTTIPYDEAIQIAQEKLKELDAADYESYTLSPTSNNYLTIYGNDDRLIWEFKFNNAKLKYYIIDVDAVTGEVINTSGSN